MKKLIVILFILCVILGVALTCIIIDVNAREPETVTKTVVKYEKLPADTIKVYNSVPYRVYDTITNLQAIYIDTHKTIEDYFKVREYKLDFGNDTIGVFTVNAKVFQNTLNYAEAHIEPVIKTVTTTKTEYKVRALQIYAMLGSSVDLRCNQIQAGVDIADKYMFGVSGVRLGNKLGYTLNVGIKF